MFKKLVDYKKYIKKYSLDKKLNINLNKKTKIIKKKYSLYYNVTQDLKKPLEPEFDDLCRLHFLVCSRKVTTILEFGVGKSTIIFGDALSKNERNYEKYVKKNLRRRNAFECFSVDTSKKWIKKTKTEVALSRVFFQFSKIHMDKFNGRICTFYEKLPNICPDLIYLDGPDLYSANNDINGITTKHSDRLPMSADILAIEHFLLPGTLIVIDGRTANARFLKSNFQRNWIYCHDVSADQHFFELCETPLGIYNEKQLKFCLGETYFKRLSKFKNKTIK